MQSARHSDVCVGGVQSMHADGSSLAVALRCLSETHSETSDADRDVADGLWRCYFHMFASTAGTAASGRKLHLLVAGGTAVTPPGSGTSKDTSVDWEYPPPNDLD